MSTASNPICKSAGCPSTTLYVLTAKHYSVRTIRNYTQEMRFIFAHYYDVLPSTLTSKDIINYINHIVKVYGVGREKCHQVA